MKSLAELSFPAEYFFDEVREGFFVSGMMKCYWAAQLKVLSVIDGICNKYNIKWFAYCGTLLGAVRHGGYIPWDDDLDICMLRDDYTRFSKIVHDELPEGYLYLDIQTEPEYEMLLGRVVNSRAIDYGKRHLEEFYGCPYTIGIDVFPLDGIYPDEEKEQKRFALEQKVMQAGEYIKSGLLSSDECKSLLTEIEEERGIRFDRTGNVLRQILLLLDELFAECPIEEAEYVTLTPACIKDKVQKHKYLKRWYEVPVRIPFENTYVSAPANYHEALTIQYGKYMVVRKGTGIHNYPVFKEQEEILAKAMGHNPFRYTFSAKELEEARRFSRPTATNHYDQVVDTIKEAHGQIEKFIGIGNNDAALQLLEGCQNLAVSIGTDIEKVYGEGTGAVKTLEEYCEKIFEFSQGEIESITELDDAVNTAKENIDDLVSGGKRKVLFIVSHFAWWRCIEEFWRLASSDKDQDVTVMVVPYFLKDLEFNEVEKVDESPKFRGIVPFVTEDKYDVMKEKPDVIVIQDPYDGWSMDVTVPERYYSENLRRFCKKLVYCPFATVDDPSGEKDTIYAALKYIIEQSGLLYADEIVIKSEKIRGIYVDTLAELSGEKYREYWNSKIVSTTDVEWLPSDIPAKAPVRRYLPWNVVYPDPVQELLGDYSKKKIMIYYTSLDYIMKHGQKAVGKIKRSFEIMEKACAEDSVTCVFSPQSAFPSLERLAPELYADLLPAIKTFNDSKGCFYDPEGVMQEHIDYVDAYYGIECYLHKKCVRAGIPVMIENLDV